MSLKNEQQLIPFDNGAYFSTVPSLDEIYPSDYTLEFAPGIDVQIMQEVLHAFVDQFPQLFLTIVEKDGSWYFAPQPTHFKGKNIILTQKRPFDFFNQKIDIHKEPLHFFILAEDGSFLMHRFCHAIGDAYSGKIILTVLMGAYVQRVKGNPIEFPEFKHTRMIDHYSSLKKDRNGNSVPKFWLKMKGIIASMTEKKIAPNHFTGPKVKDYRYEDYLFPQDRLFELYEVCKTQDPQITLNDLMVGLILHAYRAIDNSPWFRYHLPNNLRREEEAFAIGNLIGSITSEIERFEGYSVAHFSKINRQRRAIQESKKAYQGIATYMILNLNLKSYKKLFKKLNETPFAHLLISNAGSFPVKSYELSAQIKAELPLSDAYVWGYQMGGLNTIMGMSKSSKGQRFALISRAEPEITQKLIQEIDNSLHAYWEALVKKPRLTVSH